MISVSTGMIFFAVLFSLLLGIISGIIYSVLPLLAYLPLVVIRRCFHVNEKTQSKKISFNIIDFLFVLATGIFYLLLLYAFTDGVFFACTLIALFIGFFSVRKIFVVSAASLRQRKRRK